MLRSATKAARAVVMGTAETRPMLPTSVRTISSATISLFATVPTPLCAIEKSSNSGSAAPEYAMMSVNRSDTPMWMVSVAVPGPERRFSR